MLSVGNGTESNEEGDVYVTNSLNCTALNYTTNIFNRVPIVIGWTEKKVPTLIKIRVIGKVTWEGGRALIQKRSLTLVMHR